MIFGLKATINGETCWCADSWALDLYWTTDKSKALRFASADDAYRCLAVLGCDAVVDVLEVG